MLAAIRDSISNKYHQIPGTTTQKKVYHVALKTLKTLPWIASGIVLCKVTPPKFHQPLAQVCAFAPIFLPNAYQPAAGFNFVAEAIYFRKSSENCLKAPHVADKIRLFASAYVALKFGLSYFNALYNEKPDFTNSKPLNRNISLFTGVVTAATIAGMVYYCPKATLAGLTAGVLINRKVVNLNKDEWNFLAMFFPIQTETSTTRSLTNIEKLSYIWDAWNIFASAVGTNILGTLYSGGLQGRKVEWFYSAIYSAVSGS